MGALEDFLKKHPDLTNNNRSPINIMPDDTDITLNGVLISANENDGIFFCI